MQFRAWVPDEGYTREDGRDVEADDAREAAEQFAETWYESGDHFRELDVMIESDGVAPRPFRVTVDFDPTFYAEGRP